MKANGKDRLLYKLELDRGGSSSNEIEDVYAYNTINKVDVKCSINSVMDNGTDLIRGTTP